MSFITKQELTSHIYEENMDVISRDDDQKVTDAIDSAVSEAKTYLNRFDVETLFARTGSDRDPILVLYIKDIAKWHFIPNCNAGVDYTAALDRYEKAIEFLKRIQNPKAGVPLGWPVFTEPEGIDTPFHIMSNHKRGNYY